MKKSFLNSLSIIFFCLLSITNSHLFAQSSLDKTFGDDGKTLNASGTNVSSAIMPDGKILMCTQTTISCFTNNGKLDESFGQNGTISVELGGIYSELGLYSLASQPDGKFCQRLRRSDPTGHSGLERAGPRA